MEDDEGEDCCCDECDGCHAIMTFALAIRTCESSGMGSKTGSTFVTINNSRPSKIAVAVEAVDNGDDDDDNDDDVEVALKRIFEKLSISLPKEDLVVVVVEVVVEVIEVVTSLLVLLLQLLMFPLLLLR